MLYLFIVTCYEQRIVALIPLLLTQQDAFTHNKVYTYVWNEEKKDWTS
jgi:hypothetical protein